MKNEMGRHLRLKVQYKPDYRGNKQLQQRDGPKCLGARVASALPFLPRLLFNVASLVTEPLVTHHTSGSVLKDARPCRICQCRYLSKESGQLPRNLVCFLWNPQQNSLCPRATHDSARPCCPRSRVAHPATPLEDSGVHSRYPKKCLQDARARAIRDSRLRHRANGSAERSRSSQSGSSTARFSVSPTTHVPQANERSFQQAIQRPAA